MGKGYRRFLPRINSGFSLLEIMIVLVVISILTALAVPGYKRLVSRAKQTEVKNILNAIHTAQKLYFLENNTYTTDLKKIDLTVPDQAKSIYSYVINSNDPKTVYLVTAKGNLDSDPFLDEWTIDQDNNLQHIADDYDDYTQTP